MKIFEAVLDVGCNDGVFYLETCDLSHCPCWGGFVDFLKYYFRKFNYKKVRAFHLSLHSHPSKWRVPLGVFPVSFSNDGFYLFAGQGNYFEFDDFEMDKSLAPFSGKKVYLEVEYE